jgi:S-adenosylmethionine:tRNA ribosyltransferase-isomerase
MPRLKTISFDYHLPAELVAQQPLSTRDASKLLVLNRSTKEVLHSYFWEIEKWLRPGDILIANDSRVIPARLIGQKETSGGKVELLLLERLGPQRWLAIAGGRRINEGKRIQIQDTDGNLTPLIATITASHAGALREIEFSESLSEYISIIGQVPLPPYIHQKIDDPERYQTVYSRIQGSAAAPTAGLHFTPELILSLREKGILFDTVTLHIGLDTFKPVSVEDVSEHRIHTEWARLTPETAQRINEAHLAGGRIIALGTTATRVLETAALRSAGINESLSDISARDASGETFDMCPWRPVAAFEGRTDLFIYPGYRFRAVDALITNFHLPRSSLLMLVSAFADLVTILNSYEVAVDEEYRFYSFGDAMLIL